MCMCGDTYCRSCGPAQGNNRCSVCKRWTLDGGCEKPEDCQRQEQEEAEAEAKHYFEMRKAELNNATGF
jgi:hypothetical protein